jgi:hypothetical protein
VIAAIAAAVGVLTFGWTVASFLLTRKRLSRFESKTLESQSRAEHHSQLTTWIQLFLSDDRQSQEVSVNMLKLLKTASWATDEDRFKVVAVLDVIEGGRIG